MTGVDTDEARPANSPDHRCGPMRARIRHATSDIHESLHRHPGFADLMAGVLTVPGYIALLERLYGFHSPLERGLRAASVGANGDTAGHINPIIREKAHLLRSDLLDLGVSELEIEAIPLCRSLPALATPEERAGCLYVIEGAGLGGAAMAHKLDYLLRGPSRSGRQFFMGRPYPDPMPWPDFCRWLEVWAIHADVSAITLSARRTFEFMDRWLRADDGDL